MWTVLVLSICSTLVTANRQPFGTTWNDPYIPQPQNFVVYNANARCDYQIAYDRFMADNRYDVQYLAEYPDGSKSQVHGISGSLPRDNSWMLDSNWRDTDYNIQTVFFRNICRSGTAPKSFRVNFSLRDGFTYKNRWTTGSFKIASGSLPAAPSNVRVIANSKSSTVSWRPVNGATGYLALVEYMVDSEVGPLPFVFTLERGGDATSATYDRKVTRAAVVAIGDGLASQGAKGFTPLDDVFDVRP